MATANLSMGTVRDGPKQRRASWVRAPESPYQHGQSCRHRSAVGRGTVSVSIDYMARDVLGCAGVGDEKARRLDDCVAGNEWWVGLVGWGQEGARLTWSAERTRWDRRYESGVCSSVITQLLSQRSSSLGCDEADGFPASRGRVSTLPENSGRNGPIGVVRVVCMVRMELRSGASVGRGCGGKGQRLCVCASLWQSFEPNWVLVELS